MNVAVIALLFLPVMAQAQVYKCVAADGSTTYATVPCPDGAGETTRIIEPVPPSGVLNVPYAEQAEPEQAPSTDAEGQPTGAASKGPSVTGITVIPDSEDPRRQQKKEQMREDALQHKKDLADEAFRKQQRLNPPNNNQQR